MKKFVSTAIALAMTAMTVSTLASCTEIENDTPKAPVLNYGAEAYEFVKVIDECYSDRDCIAGENFLAVQEWIISNLKTSGYSNDEVSTEDFTITKTYPEANLENVVAEYTTDGKKYTRRGQEDENGTYVKATFTSQNIIAYKHGKTDKQIIVGMHYDGDGSGDNGSGIALGLITAMKLYKVETTFSLKFVFFSAEEYGLYGSKANASNMSEEEIAKTEYMINMDSLICGDYCYLYGGVQDDENKTVTKTEAYDNAMKVADSLGLTFLSNPWSYKNPTPVSSNLDENGNLKEDAVPDYASPATGNWSDHVGYKNAGIPYLYFEATNWMLGPDYDGYEETATFGPLMNTENDYLEKIEELFPGRPLSHLNKFSTLLTSLLLQETSIFVD